MIALERPGGRPGPRRFLVAMACAVQLAACGGEERAASGTTGSGFCDRVLAQVDSFLASAPDTASGERYGGTAVVAAAGEIPDGMNGLVSADNVARQHQNFVNLTTLVRYDEDLEPASYLAESWEVSADGTELTFHLRDDVVWHDGEPTDAGDVRFTYLRATDPRTGFPNAGYWRFYERGEEGIVVEDSLTVTVRLRPHVDFLDPWQAMPILPEHLLGDVPPEELRQHPYGTECPVGNGPFVFREHREDESWSFVANPSFPEGLGGRPYLDRYVYRVVPEQTTLLTELLTGGVDWYVGVRPDQADRVREADDLAFEAAPSRQYVFIGWNGRRPQLADPAVRRAITRATNRREIVDAILRGHGSVANSPVPPFHWAHDESLSDALPHDPERARDLLDGAGWIDRDGDGIRENPDGVPLEFALQYHPGSQQRQDIAEIMQSQLREVGIDARPQSVEWTTLISRVTDTEERDFDGVVLSFITDFRVDDHDLFHSTAADRPLGFAGLEVPEVDRVLDTLPLILDREEALPYWKRYQELIVEHQPYTFFYYPDRLNGVNRRLRGVSVDVRGEWAGITDWWIPEGERRYARE